MPAAIAAVAILLAAWALAPSIQAPGATADGAPGPASDAPLPDPPAGEEDLPPPADSPASSESSTEEGAPPDAPREETQPEPVPAEAPAPYEGPVVRSVRAANAYPAFPRETLAVEAILDVPAGHSASFVLTWFVNGVATQTTNVPAGTPGGTVVTAEIPAPAQLGGFFVYVRADERDAGARVEMTVAEQRIRKLEVQQPANEREPLLMTALVEFAPTVAKGAAATVEFSIAGTNVDTVGTIFEESRMVAVRTLTTAPDAGHYLASAMLRADPSLLTSTFFTVRSH